jgi:acetylornithine deacetylase
MESVDRLLRDLVAIDSVNPTLVSGAAGEAAIAHRLVQEFEAMGLPVEVQEVAPGRPNVVATLEGRAPGRSLMLCGHIDTVGVTGMAAPFTPVERQGRLHGRGAQDMKSGVAAMIDAVRVVAASGGLAAGRVVVACVVDEEHSSIGADALVTRWRADAGVVTEPTDLDIAVAHKGFEWARIDTIGRAAHGSRPAEGIDAILQMGRVLQALQALDAALQGGTGHPRLGTASLHASLIEGGRELSSYPDRCTLQLERRTLPGEGPNVLAAEVNAILTRLAGQDPLFSAEATTLFGRPPYEVDAAHPLPQALGVTARAVGCRANTIGMSFWTDAAVLGEAGIPSVLFGPSGAGLHSVDEWVDLASMRQCRDALTGLIRDWCRQL